MLDTLARSSWLCLKVRLHKPSHKNVSPQTRVTVKLPPESPLPHPTFELEGEFGLPPVCTSDPLGRPFCSLCRVAVLQSLPWIKDLIQHVDVGAPSEEGGAFKKCFYSGSDKLI